MPRVSSSLAILLLGALGACPAAVYAQELKIGVIAPEEGSLAILGEQARLALDAFAQQQDGAVTIVPAPESCEETQGADAAASMVEAGVDAVVGLFCAETIESAMPVLAASDIPAITVSVRAEIIMEDALTREWPLFRLAPSEEGEASSIATVIAERWSDEPFALIDDGTVYGRDLVEKVRLQLEQMGITPTFTDNYRPAEEKQFGLVRRLRNAGVSHIFIGGDRSDVAIIARDAAAAGFDFTLMGGDALFTAEGEIPLPDGVLAVVGERRITDERRGEMVEAIEAFLAEEDRPDMRPQDGYVLPIFAAAEIVASAKAAGNGQPGQPLVAALREGRFDTVLGSIHFGRDQVADDQGYRLTVSRNGELVPVGGGETPVR